MAGKIDDKLASLGIVLPTTTAPLANYVPARRHGSQVYVSGQVPAEGGKDKFAAACVPSTSSPSSRRRWTVISTASSA